MAKQFGKSDRWILSGEEYNAMQERACGDFYRKSYESLLVQFRALVKQHHEAAIEQKTALLILEDLSQERYGTSKLSEMLKEQAKHVKAHGALNIPSNKAHSDAYQRHALFGDELGDIRPAAGMAARSDTEDVMRRAYNAQVQRPPPPIFVNPTDYAALMALQSDTGRESLFNVDRTEDVVRLPRQQLVLRNISYGEPSLDRVGASDLVPDDAGSDDSSDDAGDDADDSTG